MSYQRKMLFRDSLDDNGDVNHHGAYCASPDMIAHSLVADPQSAFGTNYSSDPNERLDTGSRANAIYTRVKSQQYSADTITGYIRIYRADMSLFMNTDQWKNNGLRTPGGKEYVTVTTSKNGGIAVGDDILVVDGTKPYFCMIGIVNDSDQETLPEKFSSYNDFVMWVRRERCVAVRNFSLENSGRAPEYESLYHISNPENKGRLGSILVEASGLPKGTIIGLENQDLGIGKSIVFDPENPAKRQVTDSAVLEGGFNGYVKIYARLPQGQVWPAGAAIVTTFWVSAEEKEEMMQFARPVNRVLMDGSSLEKISTGMNAGRLVKVGYCKTLYI